MSKIILTEFGKRVKDSLDPTTIKTLILHIQRYFDKNNEIIYGNSPGKRLFFTDTDKSFVYEALKIQPDEVKAAMKKIPGINSNWKLLNDPFVILSTLIIRELTIRKIIAERDFVMMYLSMKFYSNRQYQSFPFEPNEQIMSYTINNLSDKFKYKALKNNYAVIKDTVLTSHATYEKQLIDGEDQNFVIYIPQMENRIGKVIKNIAELYYDNREQKKYMNLDKSFDEDTDKMLEGQTTSALIYQLAEGVTHDFYSKKVNIRLIKLASSRNDVSYSNLYNTIQSIKQSVPTITIKEMSIHILTLLFNFDNGILDRICSTEFAVFALKQLSISNTTSHELIEIKKTLEMLMNEHCSKYAATNRAATRANYRTSLYTYFVYSIIIHRCH
jgi:hypothetical protein